MVFHWSFSDCKSHHVSGMVSTHPLISKSLQSAYQSFGDCTKSTNYNWHNRLFNVAQFFQFPRKVEVFIFFFTFFQFNSVIMRHSKFHNSTSSLFFLCVSWLSLGLVVWPTLGNPFASQNPSGVCAYHSTRQILGCAYIYHLFLWLIFNFLHNSQQIILHAQSCLALYPLYANVLHSLLLLFTH